jgi:4-hydroxy-2-oxoheptanedioate aldolase
VRQANGFALAIAMVETKRALEIVDDILAVPGIDGVLVGPSDLSMALTGRLDPNCAEIDAALDHVRVRTRAVGRSAWVYASTPARAADMARKGFDVVAVSGDASIIRDGARAALATARGGAG